MKIPVGRPVYAFGQNASFWVAAAVVVHTLWTSAAPAMSYPLYAAEWHLTPAVTTAIFAVYPLMVVGTLILFGDMSDYFGRRKTMLLGLAASFLGVLLFAVAPSVDWLFVGRAFMGIGVGLSASPSAAALVEFSPAGQSQRAGSVTTAAQSLGLALALLMTIGYALGSIMMSLGAQIAHDLIGSANHLTRRLSRQNTNHHPMTPDVEWP